MTKGKMMKDTNETIKCPSCKQDTPTEYIDDNYGGICEGCAQETADIRDYGYPDGAEYNDNS